MMTQRIRWGTYHLDEGAELDRMLYGWSTGERVDHVALLILDCCLLIYDGSNFPLRD